MSEAQQQAFAKALAGLKEGPEIKLQLGANHVRMLPLYKSDGTKEIMFHKVFVVHWGVGPQNRLVRCLRPEGETCYICEYVAQLAQSGSTDAATKMQASNRYLTAAIALGTESPKPKILPMGPQILEGILSFAVQPSWGDPSDPESGYGLTISKTGSGFGTKYTVVPDRDRMAATQEWINSLPDLDKHYQIFTYDQQQMIVAGQDPNQQAQQTYVAPQQQVANPITPQMSAPQPGAIPQHNEAVPAGVLPQAPAPPAPPQVAPEGPAPPQVGTQVGEAVITGGENPQVETQPSEVPFQPAPPQAPVPPPQ